MEKKVIQPDILPVPKVPFSTAIKLGNMIYTSGQTGVDPKTGNVPETVAEQTNILLERIKVILETAGSSLDKVVKTTVFLADTCYFNEMNEVYRTFFPKDPPARSTVEAQPANPQHLVEIEAIAYI